MTDNMNMSVEDKYLRQIFPQRLKSLMVQRGITTALELSRVTGISRRSIDLILGGTRLPSAVTLAKLADGLDTTVDYLLFLDGGDW